MKQSCTVVVLLLLLFFLTHSVHAYEYGGSLDGVSTLIISPKECGGDVVPEEFLSWEKHFVMPVFMSHGEIQYGEVYIHTNPDQKASIQEVCSLLLRTDMYDVWLYKYSYVKDTTRYIFKCRTKLGTVTDEETPLL